MKNKITLKMRGLAILMTITLLVTGCINQDEDSSRLSFNTQTYLDNQHSYYANLMVHYANWSQNTMVNDANWQANAFLNGYIAPVGDEQSLATIENAKYVIDSAYCESDDADKGYHLTWFEKHEGDSGRLALKGLGYSDGSGIYGKLNTRVSKDSLGLKRQNNIFMANTGAALEWPAGCFAMQTIPDGSPVLVTQIAPNQLTANALNVSGQNFEFRVASCDLLGMGPTGTATQRVSVQVNADGSRSAGNITLPAGSGLQFGNAAPWVTITDTCGLEVPEVTLALNSAEFALSAAALAPGAGEGDPNTDVDLDPRPSLECTDVTQLNNNGGVVAPGFSTCIEGDDDLVVDGDKPNICDVDPDSCSQAPDDLPPQVFTIGCGGVADTRIENASSPLDHNINLDAAGFPATFSHSAFIGEAQFVRDPRFVNIGNPDNEPGLEDNFIRFRDDFRGQSLFCTRNESLAVECSNLEPQGFAGANITVEDADSTGFSYTRESVIDGFADADALIHNDPINSPFVQDDPTQVCVFRETEIENACPAGFTLVQEGNFFRLLTVDAPDEVVDTVSGFNTQSALVCRNVVTQNLACPAGQVGNITRTTTTTATLNTFAGDVQLATNTANVNNCTNFDFGGGPDGGDGGGDGGDGGGGEGGGGEGGDGGGF